MEARNAIRTVITISYKMIIFALVVMLINYAGGAAFRFGKAIFCEKAVDLPENAVTYSVDIPQNPSVMDVAKVLESAGVIEDKYLFFIQASLSNYAKLFYGGTFEVNTGMTPTEIMITITTVPEEEESK